MHTFYQLEKKYAFSPRFLSPFNDLFPQPGIWPYFLFLFIYLFFFFWGGGKYTPQVSTVILANFFTFTSCLFSFTYKMYNAVYLGRPYLMFICSNIRIGIYKITYKSKLNLARSSYVVSSAVTVLP